MDSPDTVPTLTPIARSVLQKPVSLTVVDYTQFVRFDSDDPNPKMEARALWMEQEGPEYRVWNMQGIKNTAQTFRVNLNSLWGTTTRAKWVSNVGPDPGHYPHPQVPARLPQRGRTHWGPSTSQRRQVFQPISFSVQFSSVAQSCPTICDPMDCSTPGFPVHHQLPELTQIHVH